MRKIASAGKIEDAAVIRYIVDGLNIKSEFKFSMYNCKSLKELKEQYGVFEHVKKFDNIEKNNRKITSIAKVENIKKKEYCFNCGSSEHKRKDCNIADRKCFSCNESGHISTNYPRKLSAVRKINIQKRVKSVSLNGVNVDGLIDTGSDVTIVFENTWVRLI